MPGSAITKVRTFDAPVPLCAGRSNRVRVGVRGDREVGRGQDIGRRGFATRIDAAAPHDKSLRH
jgi:hypothetical protein